MNEAGLRDGQLERYARGRRSERGADSYGTKYDRELHKRISSRFERRAIRRALARTGFEAGSVLDVPCGAGRLTPLLAPRASRLVSCDYSPAMLRVLRKSWSGPSFVGNAFGLPFANASFDLVFSARLAHHIELEARRIDYLEELMRVSRHWVVVTLFDADSFKYRQRELRRRFNSKRPKNAVSRASLERTARAAGFGVVGGYRISRLWSGHVFYVLERQPSGIAGVSAV